MVTKSAGDATNKLSKIVVAAPGIYHRTTWIGLLCLMAAALMTACDDDRPSSTTLLRTDPTFTPTAPVLSTITPASIPAQTSPPPTAYDAGGEHLIEGPRAESEANYPAGLLSGLPADSVQFIFVEADLVLQRPAMREEVEHGFEILGGRTLGVISGELLATADIKSAAFGITAAGGAAMVLGNFESLLEVLREAPSLAETNSRFDPPRLLDPYRDVELFVFPGSVCF